MSAPDAAAAPDDLTIPSISEIQKLEQDYQLLLKIEKAMTRLRSQAVLLLRYEPPHGHGMLRAETAAEVIGKHFTTVQGIERRARLWGLDGVIVDTERFRQQAQTLHDIVELGRPLLEEDTDAGD